MKKISFYVLAFLALLALGLASFGESTDFGFVNYDDPNVIINNPVIEGPGRGHFGQVFSEPRDHAYLPFYYASFWIDYAIDGKEPSIYHWLNICWHVLNAFLLFLLGRRILQSSLFGFLAAAIFVVHPVLTESVVWASGRKDLLSSAFMLLALNLWCRAKPGSSWAKEYCGSGLAVHDRLVCQGQRLCDATIGLLIAAAPSAR